MAPFRSRLGGFKGVVLVAEGALQAFDAAVALRAPWGDGDELEAERFAGSFEGATELAAVVDLDAADAVGPALEALDEEAFGVAAAGALEEACVRELAGGVDGAEVVADVQVAVFVEGVDLDEVAGVGGLLEGTLPACVRSFAAGSPAAFGAPADAVDAAAVHELVEDAADGAGADGGALAGEQDREFVFAAGVREPEAFDGFAGFSALPGVAFAGLGVPVGEGADAVAA